MNWTLALPELVLGLSGLAILGVGVLPKRNTHYACAIAVIGAFLLTAILVLGAPEGTGFGGQIVSDAFSRFTRLLILLGAAAGVALSIDYNAHEGLDRFEYPVLLLFATLGMLIMVSANDLMTLYVGLELLSLSLYVVAAFRRDDERSAEAGLKYFVLGALASGLLLYGSSLVYGFSGTTNFDRIADALSDPAKASAGVVVGLVFVMAGLAFKVSAVPFHMWTPDVYEGSPTPVTAFFAAAPKVAALALITRIVSTAYGPVTHDWQQIIVFISVASMLLGSFAAITQRNIKRLMAYSSIGHMGYALVGLAAGTPQGVESVIIYVAIYIAMTIGAFCCILAMEREGHAIENIYELAGLSRSRPIQAAVLAMIMFSLAGIPPLAGFFGKLSVFLAAVEAKLYVLAVIGALSSVVGAFYYIRIVKVLYFDEPARPFSPMPIELRVVLTISGAFVLLYVVFANSFVTAARAAAQSLF